MVQSSRDLEFIFFILVRVGGIIDMGPGQVLGLNSFSGCLSVVLRLPNGTIVVFGNMACGRAMRFS